jgi:hypothetical protein
LYLQALAHLHSYLIAVSPGARTYFFERLLLYAESASKLNGIVGLLASGVGHFFLIGDTEKCRETRRILLTKWNLFSPDADVAPFIVASHRNRLISFADSAKVRLFVDCLIGLSEELPIERASRELSAHNREVRTTRDALREQACSVALGRAGPADSDCVKADDSLVSWERRADLLGALVGATGLSFGRHHQRQDGKGTGAIVEVCPGVCVQPGLGGLHDKGLWLDLEVAPHVYELTHEDRHAICIEIISILGGAVRAIASGGLGAAAAVCPLIWSSGDDAREVGRANKWRIEGGDRGHPEEASIEDRNGSGADEKESEEWGWELGPADDAGDIPDILGIKVEKLAINVGKGMGCFVAHRGKCYELPEWPRSTPNPATTFFDEQRQREIIEGALRACVVSTPQSESMATIPDLAREELSRRLIWRFDGLADT